MCKNFEELPDIITADIISKFIGICLRRVYELLDTPKESGGIPCKKIGRRKIVLKSEFKKWLEEV